MTRSGKIGRLVLCLAFFWLLPFANLAKPVYTKDDFKIDFSGYVQEQALYAPMILNDYFLLSQTRFRPVLDFNFGKGFSAEFSQTLLLSAGNALQNPAYQLARKFPQPTYFNWYYHFIDNSDMSLDWDVYRAWVAYEGKKFKVVAGRQRMAYGSALFYSPLDLFNPKSPLSLNPGERVGVDGASMEYELGPSSYVSLAYGIGDNWDETRLALYYKTTVKAFDLHFLVARIFTDYIVGGAFSGNLKDGSLYGELSYTMPDHYLKNYVRGTVGYAYKFKNGISMVIEYYHDGGRLSVSVQNGSELLFSTKLGLVTIDRNLLCLSTGFSLTSLLGFSSAIIYDMDGGSFFIGPSFSISATQSISISLGAQLFGGNQQGDFGVLPQILWGQVIWNF